MEKQEIGTLQTISEMFDIPLSTLRKWCSERKFPGIIKLGRGVRVDIPVFRRWIDGHRVDGGRGGRR